MSANQESLMQNLSEQLKNFGLNPAHWQVFPLSDARAAAIHKTDGLVLLGSHRSILGNRIWSDLEIYEQDEIAISYR